jgi:hypothetical protein
MVCQLPAPLIGLANPLWDREQEQLLLIKGIQAVLQVHCWLNMLQHSAVNI